MNTEDLHRKYLECTGVSIDTRTLETGALFVALKGSTLDGNQYAGQALEKGASYVLVDNPEIVVDKRYMLVPDTLQALQELAMYHRRTLNIPVIGLTGSNGKTTTKELIAAVLSAKYIISATSGNYNNHIGVPLTLLNAVPGAEILIVEMGTNQPGDIKELCELAMPDLGIITNIGIAHLEKLLSIQGVFEEKRSLFDYVMDRGGHFFLNKQDVLLKELWREENNITCYDPDEVSLGKLYKDDSNVGRFVSLILHSGEKRYAISTHLSGSYNRENIAAALEVGSHFGIDPESMSRAISSYIPENMRSQVKQTERNMLVLDAYNANPTSMRASILSMLQDFGSHDVFFVLGDMLELGHSARDNHQAIVDLLIAENVKNVILVGRHFKEIEQEIYPVYADVGALIHSAVLSAIKDKDILIKGSRGVKLEAIVPFV